LKITSIYSTRKLRKLLRMFAKRFMDIGIVVLFAPFLLPLYLICVVTLLVFQGMPIHFKQTRVGKDGRPFELLKFRSMVENAQEFGSVSTEIGDSRITKIGKIYRTLSLDEIPQLINVLKGEMSLVGPRPYLDVQKSGFDLPTWNKRLEVLPGITGLAQINGRSNCSVEKRIKYDIKYVDEQSFWLDVKILFSTVRLVLLIKGTN